MDGFTLEELREQLDFAGKVRERQKNTLNARLQISLIWAAMTVFTGWIISCGGWYLLLLVPLYPAGGFATMVTALSLRRIRGELTEVSERQAALHWGVSILTILPVLVLLRLTGNGSPALLPLLAGFAHVLAGSHLERSYLFTAFFLLAGAILLLMDPGLLPLPGYSITAISLIAGSLTAWMRYRGS